MMNKSTEKPILKEILIITVPASIVFALSGMDFIGYYSNTSDVYLRSLPNVLWGFAFTTAGLFIFPLSG
ncbi:hypothetical protein HNR50_001887 [Spirochaeta isovalerica]|uniref:Uncharacterized protein n=1 Tax=Spirochaeta isovalerica TaxID=150 RepID=A0A841RBE0_9SPIO|nr:hypothetical protein [Spirochaeta isovalerica]